MVSGRGEQPVLQDFHLLGKAKLSGLPHLPDLSLSWRGRTEQWIVVAKMGRAGCWVSGHQGCAHDLVETLGKKWVWQSRELSSDKKAATQPVEKRQLPAEATVQQGQEYHFGYRPGSQAEERHRQGFE